MTISTIRIDVHHHFDPITVTTKAEVGDDVTTAITALMNEVRTMSQTLQQDIDTLTTQVANLTTVETSAAALIRGFAQQLADAVAAATAAGATPAQLQSLTDLGTSIDAASNDLAAAVAANTAPSPAP